FIFETTVGGEYFTQNILIVFPPSVLCLKMSSFLVSIKPSVILKPDWTQIFRGETVTLSCQIQRGGGTQLAFKWRPTNRNPPTSSEYRINKVTESHSGEYSCQGVRGFQQTGWSDVVRLTVLCKSNFLLNNEKNALFYHLTKKIG
uniref:Ig-like domain-containing protein n=1 Tax=Kryptolebias marmoratus TaxID=37003 RepID=A0A3Q3A3Z9_KRYMA